MIMEPPLGSSTVVSARRTLRAGMVIELPVDPPVTVMAFSLESSLTSVLILRLMRPSDRTTGVKPRPTPKGLNSMVTSLSSLPTGTGNSPPARNFADSPEMAVRVGSARVRRMPSRSMAR